jgi:phage host-nuclease inhibitor protein Gam
LLALDRSLAVKTRAARAWAGANPAAFGRRRSVDFGHGVAGFRHGPPRLATLAKGKWERVLQSLRGLRWGAPYIRVKEEINKEQIIADVGAGKLAEADLRRAGAQVVREETFFVEPKLTRAEPREIAKAA